MWKWLPFSLNLMIKKINPNFTYPWWVWNGLTIYEYISLWFLGVYTTLRLPHPINTNYSKQFKYFSCNPFKWLNLMIPVCQNWRHRSQGWRRGAWWARRRGSRGTALPSASQNYCRTGRAAIGHLCHLPISNVKLESL